jgi:hypothetical protein
MDGPIYNLILLCHSEPEMVGNGSKSRIITKKPGSLTKVVFMSSSLARMSARPRRSKRSRRPKKPDWVS